MDAIAPVNAYPSTKDGVDGYTYLDKESGEWMFRSEEETNKIIQDHRRRCMEAEGPNKVYFDPHAGRTKTCAGW